jgi:hypothetical protein
MTGEHFNSEEVPFWARILADFPQGKEALRWDQDGIFQK